MFAPFLNIFIPDFMNVADGASVDGSSSPDATVVVPPMTMITVAAKKITMKRKWNSLTAWKGVSLIVIKLIVMDQILPLYCYNCCLHNLLIVVYFDWIQFECMSVSITWLIALN